MVSDSFGFECVLVYLIVSVGLIHVCVVVNKYRHDSQQYNVLKRYVPPFQNRKNRYDQN